MVSQDVDTDTNYASDINSSNGVFLDRVSSHHTRTTKKVSHSKSIASKIRTLRLATYQKCQRYRFSKLKKT